MGGGCMAEFVLDAAWTPQPEPTETQDAFKGGDAHFHPLASRLSFLIEL